MLDAYQLAYCKSHQMDPDNVRDLQDGTWVLAKPLLFHWTLIRGDWSDPLGYFDRWCYVNEDAAQKALASFPTHPPKDWEPEGWHRHPPSRRRRENGKETINP